MKNKLIDIFGYLVVVVGAVLAFDGLFTHNAVMHFAGLALLLGLTPILLFREHK